MRSSFERINCDFLLLHSSPDYCTGVFDVSLVVPVYQILLLRVLFKFLNFRVDQKK